MQLSSSGLLEEVLLWVKNFISQRIDEFFEQPSSIYARFYISLGIYELDSKFTPKINLTREKNVNCVF